VGREGIGGIVLTADGVRELDKGRDVKGVGELCVERRLC